MSTKNKVNIIKRKRLYKVLFELICEKYNINNKLSIEKTLFIPLNDTESDVIGIFLLTCKNLTGLSIKRICSYYTTDYVELSYKWSYFISTNRIIHKEVKTIEDYVKFKLLTYGQIDKNLQKT